MLNSVSCSGKNLKNAACFSTFSFVPRIKISRHIFPKHLYFNHFLLKIENTVPENDIPFRSNMHIDVLLRNFEFRKV